MSNYKENRKSLYPSVEDQLDMLWHSLNIHGTIAKEYAMEGETPVLDEWFAKIKEIKDANPAPT
jgi:hypothetical protein